MKPRVLVETDVFCQLAKSEGKTVIKTDKLLLQGHMYVIDGDSYYYYAHSSEPLKLPAGIDVIDAKLVSFA